MQTRRTSQRIVEWFNACLPHRCLPGGRVALTVLLFSALLTSCATQSTRAPLEDSAPPPRVTLASGDVIKLVFAGAPELNQSQKIAADGKLSLPQVGEVTAAGRTITQLQAELSALYKTQLHNSDVVVILEKGITTVYLAGAVKRPGPLAVDRPTTLLQAIMHAGGPNQFANVRRVQVIRLVNGREQSEQIDLRPTLEGKVTTPFYVRDGDVISVPQKAF